MTYIPQNWENGSEGGTPITAERLEYMETGIEDATDTALAAMVKESNLADVANVATARKFLAQAGAERVNVRDYGAVGDGATNDTDAIADAIVDAPAGATLYLPEGIYLTDPFEVPKALTLAGDGRYSSWLQPNSPISEPLVQWAIGAFGGSVRNYYGPSMIGLGLDLGDSPAGTAIACDEDTQWFVGHDLYVNGGAVGISNAGFNNRFEQMRMVDCGIFFDVDGETGLELTLKDIDAIRFSAGTTTSGIRVIATTAGTKGDLRLDNVRIHSTPGDAAVILSNGLTMQSTSLNLSMPVFAHKFVVDNAKGPAIILTNTRDSHFAEGWGNSAGGTTPTVQIAGGGNHKFIGNTWFGGSGGASGIYEFTGAEVCNGFVSRSNYCPTGPVYRLTGAGKPTDLYLDDFSVGATLDAHITNDLPNLLAGMGRNWGGHWFNQLVRFGTELELQEGVNLDLGTTVGTKFGNSPSQKLAFYNSNPIVQPANTTDLREVLINLGLLASGGATPLNLNGGAFASATAAVGTNPASTGVIRVPNNEIIYGRNAANNGDVPMIYVNTGNQVTVAAGSGGLVIGEGAIIISDGGGTSAVQFGTTSGTKIGTATNQKLAFWNATPIVQPAAVADAAGGGTVDTEARTALNALLARLRTLGLIAT